jgi:NAD(P)-dependent dehydrogenase (short-subunit alcohol dehydrogenase family)
MSPERLGVVIGLVKALAVEFGPRAIRVNAILPGGTDTPAASTFADTEDKKGFVRGMHALKRIATPNEIAQSVLYLGSTPTIGKLEQLIR